MLKNLRFRLRALVRRGRPEDDLDDELRFHLKRAVEQHVARGLSVREARRRARLAFGPIDAIKDDCRQAWGLRLVDDVAQDLRFGARGLWRKPGFAVGSLFIVAFGVAAPTAIFSVANAVFVRPLPYPEATLDRFETAFKALNGLL